MGRFDFLLPLSKDPPKSDFSFLMRDSCFIAHSPSLVFFLCSMSLSSLEILSAKFVSWVSIKAFESERDACPENVLIISFDHRPAIRTSILNLNEMTLSSFSQGHPQDEKTTSNKKCAPS